MKTRVLLIANVESIWTYTLIKELNEPGLLEVGCFDTEYAKLFSAAEVLSMDVTERMARKKRQSPLARTINILMSIPSLYIVFLFYGYNRINILGVSKFYLFFLPVFFLRRNFIVTILGGDFLRASNFTRGALKPVFNLARHISFTNHGLLNKFDAFYARCYSNKLRISMVGLPLLEFIDKGRAIDRQLQKRKFKIPPDKISVVCGTYPDKGSNQNRILTEIISLPGEIKSKLHLVLPYTYNGSPELLRELNGLLEASSCSYTILTDFMSLDDLAALRLSTDILIHLPITDQLSGAMLETLYAGGVLMTGSWLPYQLLDDRGVFFIKIDDFDELSGVISKLVPHPGLTQQQREKNKDGVYEIGSWEHQKKSWLELYSA